MSTRLSRDYATRPVAPARIIHLGVGAFHRAHQAVYTNNASDAGNWGIVGFTGRSPAIAEQLAAQDCLYTVIERGPDIDRFHVVESIVGVHSATNIPAWVAAAAAPTTALVTVTVTEAGYGLTGAGLPALDDARVQADLDALRSGATKGSHPPVRTVLGKLSLALQARRDAGLPGVAIVPCDNVPDNGNWLRTGLLTFAGDISKDLERWISQEVSFVSTSVDRITPRSGPEAVETVQQAMGLHDVAPVVTEPFSDWVLQGDFPGGRPRWEDDGAKFVTDIASFESRKLWMLNGAHTLLAAHGTLRGHTTVSSAINDPVCRAAVEGYWAEAAAHLPESVGAGPYSDALVKRFQNARIEHQLSQIAQDSLGKLRHRVVPVAEAEQRAGRPGTGTAQVIAAWIQAVRTGRSSQDAEQSSISGALQDREPDLALLNLVAPGPAKQQAYRLAVLKALSHLHQKAAL